MTARPGLLLASVALLAATAGCVQDREPDRPDDGVARFCLLAVNPEPQGPETVLDLTWERFQQMAPHFAAQLEDDTGRTGPTHDLGGRCDDGFGLESGRLANEFEGSDAEHGSSPGGDRMSFFRIGMEDGEQVLTRLNAEYVMRLGWHERAAADGGADVSTT